jgi:hypothetical protein
MHMSNESLLNHIIRRPHRRMDGRPNRAQLWLILGDGVNQAADFTSGATSIPSWNLTRWMTFGNRF